MMKVGIDRVSGFWRTILLLSVVGLSVALPSVVLWGADKMHPTQEISVDVLVFGSSLGGTSAAITLAEHGRSVVLATDSQLVGGQAVESGMSAFDDADNLWENYGLYADLQRFLEKKYGQGKYGSGLAAVGKVASIPQDIAEYFLSKISQNNNLRLLKGYRLLELKGANKQWNGALLQNISTREELLVQFKYIVDGTTTGRLLEQANEPYSIGFDAKEDTKERSALPKLVRDYFIDGFKEGVTNFQGWGNRVQAVSSPFALLDKGYPGDFYSVNTPDTECWKSTGQNGYIIRSKVFKALKAGCEAEVRVQPAFSDTYDVYFVNHGNEKLDINIQFPYSSSPISLQRDLLKDKQLIKIGTFFVGQDKASSFRFKAKDASSVVEGLVFVKANLHQSPIVLSGPFKENIPLKRSGYALVNADMYFLTGDSQTLPETLQVEVDNVQYLADKTGKGTYFLDGVQLTASGTLKLSQADTQSLKKIVIVPTRLSSRRIELSWDKNSNSSVKDLAKKSETNTWKFTLNDDGDYLLSVDWNNPEWSKIFLKESGSGGIKLSLSFKQKYSMRNASPLTVLPLKAGREYEISMDVSTEKGMRSFPRLILEPLQKSNLLYMNKAHAADGRLRIAQIPVSGVYDVWVRGKAGSLVNVLSTNSFLQQSRNDVPVDNADIFQYAGKYFLHRSYALSAGPPGTELLAIPNSAVDTYVRTVSPKDAKIQVELSRLPLGRWFTVIGNQTKNERAGNLFFSIEDSISHVQQQQIPLFPANSTLINRSSFIHQGDSTMVLPALSGDKDAEVWLHEEIPDLKDSWSFALQGSFFSMNWSEIPRPLFLFRNIVSPASLQSGLYASKFIKDIASHSMGMTLVAEPSNDFAPVFGDAIDSREIVDRSRSRSYQYYYWMRYDMRPNAAIDQCSPEDVTCSPKRAFLQVGLFPGTSDIFAQSPYYREGRRIRAATPLGENDIMLDYLSCTGENTPCNEASCIQFSGDKQSCIKREQEYHIPQDAVVPFLYNID
ncbi:MAG: FAD-dependent oxidoreductase, partial [Candidatus Peribacteraceae bacterium]|nr:FAD-dependent oxidoreductase [Candidatus Peribacteraceae bacterium]